LEELIKTKISDIYVTKEREEIDGIEPLAQSISQAGRLIEPVILYRDEKNRILVAAGRRRIRALEMLKWEYVDAIFCTQQEAELIRIDENLRRQELTAFQRAKSIRERVEILKRMGIGVGKNEGKRGRPPGGKTEAIKRAARDIGASVSTIKRELQIADISKNASEKIAGTKLENDKMMLVRIAQQPKEKHLRLVDAIQSGETFEEAMRKLESKELKGQEWPDDFNDIFIYNRRELFFLISKIKGELNRNYSILSKYKGKPHRNQIYQAAVKMREFYEEIIANLLLAIPTGPCPYCDFKGCEKCLFDGYAPKGLLITAEEEGIMVKKYYFSR